MERPTAANKGQERGRAVGCVDWRSVASAAVVLLAGCSGEPPSAGERLGAVELDSLDVETTDQLGGIRGVVVDEAIRPVAGAAVTLGADAEPLRTNEGGLFSADRLEPDTYFLEATALGFLPARVVVEVYAGQVAEVRVLLAADPSPTPFRQTIKFDGHIQASVPLVSYVVDILLVDLLDQSHCACALQVDSGQAETIVFEMVWQPSTPGPAPAEELYYQFYQDDGSNLEIESDFHPSPVLEHWDRKALWGGTTLFQAHYGGSALWPTINQPFTSFITFWYRTPAPDGWSIAAGDS